MEHFDIGIEAVVLRNAGLLILHAHRELELVIVQDLGHLLLNFCLVVWHLVGVLHIILVIHIALILTFIHALIYQHFILMVLNDEIPWNLLHLHVVTA